MIGACLTGAFFCSRAAFRIMEAAGGRTDLQYRLDLGAAAPRGERALHVGEVRTVGAHQCRRPRRPAVQHPVQLPPSGKHPRRVAFRPAGPTYNQEPMMETETVAQAALCDGHVARPT